MKIHFWPPFGMTYTYDRRVTALSGEASFAKLKDGSWGIRVPGKPREGASVTVVTKGGSRKTVTVGRILWTGPDRFNGDQIASLCTIEAEPRPQAAPSRSRTCSECGQPHARLTPCSDSSGIGGDCCPSCARMSRYERSFG